MIQSCCEHALTRVVVKPSEKNSTCHCVETPPGNPCRSPVSLYQRDNMPSGPYQPEENAGLKCVPPILHRVNGVSRPTQLFSQGRDKEHEEQHKCSKKLESRGCKRQIQRVHQPIRQDCHARHQQKDWRVPDLRSDSLVIERSL